MAITVKKGPGWVPGQKMTISGTGGRFYVPAAGGGGGGMPDSSNVYSVLRRGVNQYTILGESSQTVITAWSDARGAGAGRPKYLSQGTMPAPYSVVNQDGSINIAGNKGLRATTDDSNTSLVDVAAASWTAYARIKSPSAGSTITGTPIAIKNSLSGGSGVINTMIITGQPNYNVWPPPSAWFLSGYQNNLSAHTPIEAQWAPNPNEYQTVVMRGSPSAGWSFRVSNSNNSGGSFGTNYTLGVNGQHTMGSVLWVGDYTEWGPGYFTFSDLAIYKSYHSEETATQVISYLETSP